MVEPKSLRELANLLAQLPGIGPKTARRLALHILKAPKEYASSLSKVLQNLHSGTVACSFCNVISDVNPCPVCADTKRDLLKLAVVKSSLDVYILENSQVFNGLYWVVGDNVFESSFDADLLQSVSKNLEKRIKNIINTGIKDKKINKESTLEIIFAFGGNLEEQTVMLYLKEYLIKNLKYLRDINIKFTKLAVGISAGTNLDFVDTFTLKEALEGRRRV